VTLKISLAIGLDSFFSQLNAFYFLATSPLWNCFILMAFRSHSFIQIFRILKSPKTGKMVG